MSDLRDAAELALTALENTCPNTWTSVKENLRKALAQPEPEPVAWLVQYPNKHEFVWGEKPKFTNGGVLAVEPLYTAPVHAIDISQERVDETAKHKHEWVGLTDEEIENLWEMAQAWNAPKHFYILIAAKLKEKNT
jgi:hypothetical protein